tara:strand:+ start:197 stop:424 length:228 start_codon:yes stop_codon:yes gene_type:complete
MKILEKLHKAITTLKSDAEYTFDYDGDNIVVNEETFNTIKWKTGEDENEFAILTDTNPHSEITWTAVKELMDSYD